MAVVGKQAIMQSQLDEQFFQLLGTMPPAAAPKTAADSAKMRKQVLSDLVDDELLVQEAARDTSIKVTDKEVIDAVAAAIKNIRDRYTTETRVHGRAAQGRVFASLDEYRRFLAEQSRRDMQKDRLKQLLKDKGKLKPVAPSEQEMKAFYEEQQGQFGSRPATVSFRQVVVAPRPTDAAKSRALALADSILVELRKGADFAVAAKRFSADPGSRERGGDLGWARRGVFVPEFDRVAFSLKIGVISEPVETPFGYHLIQVMRTQPGEIQVRHILIAAEVTAADVDSAAARAQQVYKAVLAGAVVRLAAARSSTTVPRSARRQPCRSTSCPRCTSAASSTTDSHDHRPALRARVARWREEVRRRHGHRAARRGRSDLPGRA